MQGTVTRDAGMGCCGYGGDNKDGKMYNTHCVKCDSPVGSASDDCCGYVGLWLLDRFISVECSRKEEQQKWGQCIQEFILNITKSALVLD
eukprot:gene11688-3463_t